MSSNYKISSMGELEKQIREFSKRYYPEATSDYSDYGFNSMLFGILSYIGEKIMFYQDYYINEKFLSTANDLESVLKHARRESFQFVMGGVALGTVSFYVDIPAGPSGPMEEYIPTLLSGSIFYSDNNVYFTLNEDVDFSTGEVRVGKVDETTGLPLSYIYKKDGLVLSGRIVEEKIKVADFSPFPKVYFGNMDVAEVVRVYDSEGNTYYEVENLAQNIIYKKNSTGSVYPMAVPYRYVLSRDSRGFYLMFGSGSQNIDFVKSSDDFQRYISVQGRDYISDKNFDPYCLIKNDKFGIAPNNTELTIVYRTIEQANINVGVGGITSVVESVFRFRNDVVLEQDIKESIQNSLECYNFEPIIGQMYYDNTEELKEKIIQHTNSQRRAVSYEDYIAIVYSMPRKFGSIKRCSVSSSYIGDRVFVNIYVASVDEEGKLVKTNEVIKKNLYEWLKYKKVLSDSINIFDLNIVNLGLEYNIICDHGSNKIEAVKRCNEKLRSYFSSPLNGGESFDFTNVYKILTSIPGVVDVSFLNVVQKLGGMYSSYEYDLLSHLSGDGKIILAEKDIVFEFKYVDLDISGSAV